jgi:hypothetical protein
MGTESEVCTSVVLSTFSMLSEFCKTFHKEQRSQTAAPNSNHREARGAAKHDKTAAPLHSWPSRLLKQPRITQAYGAQAPVGADRFEVACRTHASTGCEECRFDGRNALRSVTHSRDARVPDSTARCSRGTAFALVSFISSIMFRSIAFPSSSAGIRLSCKSTIIRICSVKSTSASLCTATIVLPYRRERRTVRREQAGVRNVSPTITNARQRRDRRSEVSARQAPA